MKKTMGLLAGFALLLACQSTAVRAFDPGADASQTAKCFATYMTLADATAKAQSEPDSEPDKSWFLEGVQGIKRIHPYVEASARLQGGQFYATSYGSRRFERMALERWPTNSPERAVLLAALAKDAAVCDRQLDAWAKPSKK